MNHQLELDLKYTFERLSCDECEKLQHATVLITGGAGFLGFYLTHFFYCFRDELKLKRVICLDNFMLGIPDWLANIEDSRFEIRKFNIISDDIACVEGAEDVDYVIHMASIASPTFYRRYPIETLDANIWGLRRLLDFYKEKKIKGFLFFSSSELYGDPPAQAVPTPETYFGNVCATGPRACYDEAKRFGETMCMLFADHYGLPIRVVRPFNNYGPGMSLGDKRVPADFAESILKNQDIQILSDGNPTRTFCYIADAAAGYLKTLLYKEYDFFNIGIEKPEISVSQLAEIYKDAGREICGYTGEIVYAVSQDQHYLTNNPQRRCPDISKARDLLKYSPQIEVNEGVSRFLKFLKEG